MIKGYIVDMDGTILDSMFIWDNIVAMLLQKKGITIDNKLKNTLAPLSIDDALKYIKEKYQLSDTIFELQNKLSKILEYEYLNKAMLKPGAKDFIKNCAAAKKKLCLLTANGRDLTIKILEINNLLHYFDTIITCDDTKLTKQDSTIYQFAAQSLDLSVNECIVIEDALHAIYSAKKAGFIVWAVADNSNIHDWHKIKEISNASFKNMKSITLS